MATRQEASEALGEALGDEYEAISFRLSWGGVSLGLFLLGMLMPYLLRLQPWRPAQVWLWPLMPGAATGALALVGLTAGLIGWRRSGSRGVAKIGVLLNGVVVGCILLVFLAMLAIFYLR